MPTSDSDHTGQTSTTRFDVVLVLASLGGLQAVSHLLSELPDTFTTPLLVLQHGRRGTAPERLPHLLQRHSALPVSPVGSPAHSSPVTLPCGVHVLAPGYTATFDQHRRLLPIPADHLGGGDALFTAVAETLRRRLIGVVLTGMLRDGA